MDEEKFKNINLPETLTPLEYQSKALKKELPPIIILKEATPGSHSAKLQIKALGKENEDKVRQFDRFVAAVARTGDHAMMNQEPFVQMGPITQSGWEFMGAVSTAEAPYSLQTTRDIAEKLGLPVYYQEDSTLYLVKSSITESSQLQELAKEHH